MNGINFTIVVQGFNFFIAYLLLNKFLFKPIVKKIDQDTSLKEKLNSEVIIEKELLGKKETNKQNQWNEFQKYFSQNSPNLSEILFPVMEKPLKKFEITELDPNTSKRVKESLEKYLLEKAENVS